MKVSMATRNDQRWDFKFGRICSVTATIFQSQCFSLLQWNILDFYKHFFGTTTLYSCQPHIECCSCTSGSLAVDESTAKLDASWYWNDKKESTRFANDSWCYHSDLKTWVHSVSVLTKWLIDVDCGLLCRSLRELQVSFWDDSSDHCKEQFEMDWTGMIRSHHSVVGLKR